MPRAVSDPRQMALRQTLQRNVFRKPIAGTPKGHPRAGSRAAGAAPPAEDPAQQGGTQKPMPASAGAKVGRNDPCPCGSGKKSKRCCG